MSHQRPPWKDDYDQLHGHVSGTSLLSPLKTNHKLSFKRLRNEHIAIKRFKEKVNRVLESKRSDYTRSGESLCSGTFEVCIVSLVCVFGFNRICHIP